MVKAASWSTARTRTEKREMEAAQQAISAPPDEGLFGYLLALLAPQATMIRHAGLPPTLLAQYALQARTVQLCYNYLESQQWSSNLEEEQTLKNVYMQFFSEEISEEYRGLAGRWRSITWALLKNRRNKEIQKDDVLSSLSQILVAFGGRNTHCNSKAFYDRFSPRLDIIISGLNDIETIIKEGVSSVHVQPVIIEPGEHFASEFMEVQSLQGCPRDDEVVVAPVALGLKEITCDNDGVLKEASIFKAKVVVGSIFSEAA